MPSKVITATAEIGRPPADVFDHVIDASRLPDWQPAVEEAWFEPPGVPAVGLHGAEVRRLPGGRRTFHWKVTEHEPAQRWSIAGIDGPVRAHATLTFSPTSGGSSTHVEYHIWFEGHGVGKLLAVLARHGSRRDLPTSLALLTQGLEGADARL